MKGVKVRVLGIVFAVVIVLSAGDAAAQFLGQMSPASVIDPGTGKTGGYFIKAEDAVAVVGSVRYGFGEYTEGRFRIGFIDPDGKAGDPNIILGIDAKYLLWKYIRTRPVDSSQTATEYYNPFDLSIGGAVEYANFDYGSILGIGGSAIASLPYRLKNNSVIEPYARLNIRYENEQYDFGDDDADLEIGLNLGALFSVTPLVDFTAEFQLDDQWAFMLGIDIATF
jgi:hypothetical protein